MDSTNLSRELAYDIALITDTEVADAVVTAKNYLKLVATGIKARFL